MARKLGDGREVSGVGVGVPGTVERPDGTLIQAVNLPLRNIALRALLNDVLDAPVVIENDGNCAALGEHRFGAAAGTTHSVTLTLGTGVGGGIVADGGLLAGARGTGGELGHIVIERNGRHCQGSCPGRGHLEAYCSGTALGARGREAGYGDAHDVLARATTGDQGALALIDELAAALGAGLVSLANALAPEVFVIGGGLGDACADLILPRAGRILREQALPPNGEARLLSREPRQRRRDDRRRLPRPPMTSGTLRICGTPIGNLGDVTQRLRDSLAGAAVIACEDTRRTRALLTALGIPAPRLERLDANTEERGAARLVERLLHGDEVALVTDAGMPAVSDPGTRLVLAAAAAGVVVEVIPGPSAVTAAFAASGIEGDGFAFIGFLPRTREASTPASTPPTPGACR